MIFDWDSQEFVRMLIVSLIYMLVVIGRQTLNVQKRTHVYWQGYCKAV